MVESRIIQKITAICMLVLFSISITPVIVFHNWLASHTDTCKKNTDPGRQQLGKQTFNCHCDHVVAESPFTSPDTTLPAALLHHFAIPSGAEIVSLPVSPAVFYSLRGPPAV